MAINNFGHRYGADMYNGHALTGINLHHLEKDIISKVRQTPASLIYLFGYSVGGDQAFELSRRLLKKGITSSGLVCFDPHAPLNPFFRQSQYPDDGGFLKGLNFIQRSPHNFAENPFQGGFIPGARNIDLTQEKASHSTIVNVALSRYFPDIIQILGLEPGTIVPDARHEWLLPSEGV